MRASEDLPTALLRERDRVREVAELYEEIGPSGAIALMVVIRPALERADFALTQHDAAAMAVALASLREIEA